MSREKIPMVVHCAEPSIYRTSGRTTEWYKICIHKDMKWHLTPFRKLTTRSHSPKALLVHCLHRFLARFYLKWFHFLSPSTFSSTYIHPHSIRIARRSTRWKHTSDRSIDFWWFGEWPKQAVVHGPLRKRSRQSQRLPNNSHFLRLPRMDWLQSGSESLRRWTWNGLAYSFVSRWSSIIEPDTDIHSDENK